MKKQSNFSKLMSYAGRRKPLTYLSMILAAVSAIMSLVPLVYIYLIIREIVQVAPHFEQATHIVQYGWLAVLWSVVYALVYFGALMCSHVSAFRIAANMRKTLMSHINRLPLGFVSDMGSGKIRRIVNDSTQATETYLAHQLPDMASAIATALGFLAFLFIFDWRYGLICLIPIALGFLVMIKMAGPGMAEDMRHYQNALGAMNNEAVEYVRGIPVIKTFGQTVHSFRKFKDSIVDYYNFTVAYCKKCRPVMLAYTVCINSAFACLIVLTLVLSESSNAAFDAVALSFIFYVLLTPAIGTAMSKIMYMSENGMIVNDAITRMHTILDVRPLPQAKTNQQPADCSVTFEDVSFRYPGAHQTYALEDVTFDVRPGQMIALVGPSGGGKTTAAALIARFWDVTDGVIRIGGIDVRDIPEQVLTQNVSYVFQDSKLLKASILENVRLGNPAATPSDVLKALHDAQCEEIIARLPDGVDTVIGTDGVYLSGGEQQRIAVARAILRNAPILVLDEATAFADPENEALVQQAFRKLSVGKTVIMIAHRLTTVCNADQILVMNGGRIVESGTHHSLVHKKGLYAKMWKDFQTATQWRVGDAA